ncbi:ABC transporter permease [Streptomyces polychromogenes]|uniref:Transport permease protein n=1 Tax=Streptomyces polychromogenes TaxID=67342 RepID=A0ABN0V8E9_9ACTN
MTQTTLPEQSAQKPGRPATARLLPALSAVWHRELLLFRRYWPATTFGSLVEPLIYMAGFGLGFGALIDEVEGHSYLEFIGTGMVVTSVLFSSAFAGMFESYNRRRYQRIYDSILSQPVDVGELVTAEASWIAAKSAVYGCAPLAVTLAVGLPWTPQLLLVPLIALLAGFAFGTFGMWVSCLVPAMDWLRLVVSGVLTPLVMAAGVFFPLGSLPGWAAAASLANPIQHCAELVRHAAFGTLAAADLGHTAALLVFGGASWILAVRGMNRRLID